MILSLDDQQERKASNLITHTRRRSRALRKSLRGAYNVAYDPVNLFVWGQMMAVVVMNLLKAVEREFGQPGQDACIRSMISVGRDIAAQSLEGVKAPYCSPLRTSYPKLIDSVLTMGSIRDESKILGSEDQSQDHPGRPKRKARLRDLRRVRRSQFPAL